MTRQPPCPMCWSSDQDERQESCWACGYSKSAAPHALRVTEALMRAAQEEFYAAAE